MIFKRYILSVTAYLSSHSFVFDYQLEGPAILHFWSSPCLPGVELVWLLQQFFFMRSMQEKCLLITYVPI